MNRRRLILGTLLFALMFFELSVRSYFIFIHVESLDGWSAKQKQSTGLITITGADPKGPATALKVGDEFISINGITRNQDFDIVNYCQRVPPGTLYKMTVRRDGKEITFNLNTVKKTEPRWDFEDKVLVLTGIIFLIVGYVVLILKPDSKQAWLLSLTLFTFPILFDSSPPVLIFGVLAVYLYSFAKIFSFFFVIYFSRLFLYFPEESKVLKRFPGIDKYLILPFVLFILPSWGAGRMPGNLRTVYFSTSPMIWLNKYKVFEYASMPVFILYILTAVIFMAINYKSSDKVNRERLRTVFAGTGICATLLLISLLFQILGLRAKWPELDKWIGYIFVFSTPLLPLSFAYSIIRHKVIPISVIIRRSVRYFLVSKGSAAILIALIYIIMFFIMKFVYHYFDITSIQWVSAVSGITAIVVWVTAYNLHQQKIAPIIDRKFFRESYDAREILSGLQQSMMTVTDSERLLQSVGQAIQSALHSDSVSFFVVNDNPLLYKKALSVSYKAGIHNYKNNGAAIPSNSFILKYLNSYGEMDVEDFYPVNGENHSEVDGRRASDNEKEIASILKEAESSLLIPIKFRNNVSGLISLGSRLGDQPYSREDRQMLKSIAGQMASLLENIRLKDIEAQNEMRAKELEGARNLQLSLLPKVLPRLPGLEIAAYMKTATEVGGDYYDFHLDNSGTLTVVVGDATGHGLKAGTMVTAAKSFFEAFADRSDIAQILRQSSVAIKRMNLRPLFMAMTMLKIKGRQVSMGNAGMPPILIYRAEVKAVEEIALTGIPLGAPTDYTYRTVNAILNPGDVILVMSDGLAERFDYNNEMLDYIEVKKSFALHGTQSPQTIINKLVMLGESWGGMRPQDDDITFVAIKIS